MKEWPPAAAECERPRRGEEGSSELDELDTEALEPALELADEETRGGTATKKKTKGKSTRKTEVMSPPSEWQLRADDDILGCEKAWNVDMVVLSACESSKGQVGVLTTSPTSYHIPFQFLYAALIIIHSS